MIQKIHHGTRGMIDINRTVQNDEFRSQKSFSERLKGRCMRTVIYRLLKAGETAQTGLSKILRQKKLTDISADLPGQLSGNRTGTADMILPVYDHNLHRVVLLIRQGLTGRCRIRKRPPAVFHYRKEALLS